MGYKPVVGLEIHVQAKTKSKMFCRCDANYFNEAPNTHVCPVCFGLPGALPVPNKDAFEKAIKLALALNCTINKHTKFDRKNYFYPDLPKGYQISQYDQPIGENGYLEIEINGESRRIAIQRIHLEEDTGKSMHIENEETLIDYNKSGVPLIEIVTKPDFESTEEVMAFAKRLRQMVRYTDVSDAEMQKGQMRYELNISVKKEEEAGLPNYKVEVKNIGSISVLEKVLSFEVERQKALLEQGEKIKNQTRGLKDMTGETVFQRSKESSDDYRYFPEPDIAPIEIQDSQLAVISGQIPELPNERYQRYLQLGLNSEQCEIFVEEKMKGDFFDEFLKYIDNTDLYVSNNIKEAAKLIIGDISGLLEKRKTNINYSPITSWGLTLLIEMFHDNKISRPVLKDVIIETFEKDDEVLKLLDKVEPMTVDEGVKILELDFVKKGLINNNSENMLDNWINDVIAANPKVVEDIKKNPNAIKFLVGQVMRLSRGTVNPNVVEEKLKTKLSITN